jgi:hypothetical protein
MIDGRISELLLLRGRQVRISEPDEPELGEAGVRPGALLAGLMVVEMHLCGETRGRPASFVGLPAENERHRFNLHEQPVQGGYALRRSRGHDQQCQRRIFVIVMRLIEQIVRIVPRLSMRRNSERRLGQTLAGARPDAHALRRVRTLER